MASNSHVVKCISHITLAELAGIKPASMKSMLKERELDITAMGAPQFRRSSTQPELIYLSEQEFPYIYASLSSKSRASIMDGLKPEHWKTVFETVHVEPRPLSDILKEIEERYGIIEKQNADYLKQITELKERLEDVPDVSERDLKMLDAIKQAYQPKPDPRKLDHKAYINAIISNYVRKHGGTFAEAYTMLYDCYDQATNSRCRVKAKNVMTADGKGINILSWFEASSAIIKLTEIAEQQFKDYLVSKESFLLA